MIKIFIDSASDISRAEAETMGITMIPMEVTIGGEEYLDGVDLLPTDFYEKLVESTELPKTSLINEYRWTEAFTEGLKEGDEIIAITISSKLSGTFAAAKRAAEAFSGRVHVVDSMNAAIGERLLCQYALRLIEGGMSATNVVKALEKEKSRICVMAVIDTLEYLKKGGRISAAVAFAGSLISIKPVIEVADGEVKIAGKALGSRKGNNLLNKLVQERSGIDFSMPFGTVWSGLEKKTLEKYIADSASLWEANAESVPQYILGGTIGTHVGPGAVGVAFFCNALDK